MIQKIIIAEGLDRCGKGTALDKLELDISKITTKSLTDKVIETEVVSIFKGSALNEPLNKAMSRIYEPLSTSKASLNNHLNYDLMSLGALEMFPKLLAPYHFSSKQFVILIDRFALSNLVYGPILRRDAFEKSFPDVDLLENYCFSAIEAISKYAPISIFVAVRPVDFVDYIDDNENVNISVSSTQLSAINFAYRNLTRNPRYLELRAKASIASRISSYMIQINTTNHYEFYDKIKPLILNF